MLPPIHNTRLTHRNGKSVRGFALIITLALMAFILLTLMSLSYLTQAELSSDSSRRLMSEARQNALLGLNVALGELQQTLGPDRRISAVANIKDTEPENDVDAEGLKEGREYWTGVWNVTANSDNEPQKAFSRWLVSGLSDINAKAETTVMSAGASFTDPVEFKVGSGTVEAGKVEVSNANGLISRYAYWVGDEGVKAKVNIKAEGTAENRSILPGQYGVKAVTGLDWLPPLVVENLDIIYDKGSMKNWVESGGGNPAVVEDRFHDLTPYSYGVLSNTVNGGLRIDLTTELFTSTGNVLSGQIFGSTSTNAAPGGPQWQQLRSWLALAPDDSDDDSAYPVQAATEEQAGMHPVLTGVQVYFIPTYNPDGTVRMHLMPAVTIWNPYSVPLKSATYTIEIAKTYFQGTTFYDFVSLWNNWYLDIGQVEDGRVLNHKQGTSSSGIRFYFTTGKLDPGQVVVFSAPAGHTEFMTDQAKNPPAANATLEAGYRPGHGFYYDTPLKWPTTVDVADRKYSYKGYSAGTTSGNAPVSGVQSARLFLGVNGTPLQSLVYGTNRPQVDNPGATGTEFLMHPTPGEGAPITNTIDAFGVKNLMVFIDNMRTWNPASNVKLLPDTRSWLAHHNPRASLHGPIPTGYADTSPSVTLVPTYISAQHKGGSQSHIGFDPVAVGYSEDESSPERTVLFDPPPARKELYSIGQLAHAPLYAKPGATGVRASVENAHFDNLIPAYAIGNSLANPTIPLDKTSNAWSYTPSGDAAIYQFSGTQYDYSYLLNRALWDRYFFSARGADGSANNPRLVSKTGAMATVPGNAREAASDALINGAFNINSTSEEAWRALLASFFGATVVRADAEMDGPDANDPHSPFTRFRKPIGAPLGEMGDDLADTEEVFVGYRRLSQAQIEDLAKHIVEQVKLRGPFGSVAEFVNRMPGSDEKDFQLRGALSAAIEATSINDPLKNADLLAKSSGSTGIDADAEATYRTENLPGWLSQADVLARIGSVITARSDTFRIRSYGEVEEPGGATSVAACEIVVQRVPDFVNPTANAAHTPLNATEATALGLAPLVAENETFGRRFVVVSFRWLNEEEL